MNWRVFMTRLEIHIRSVLRKKGYWLSTDSFFKDRNVYEKLHWKDVENGSKFSYCHVMLYFDLERKIVNPIFFTDTTFKKPEQLKKYFVIYNRVKADIKELGFKIGG